jgi:hypothetical protein
MMNVGDYLLATIERIAKRLIVAREPLCLTGEVTAVDPLKIRVKNYELTEEHLVIDVRCTEQWIKIPKDGANKHVHTIKGKTKLAKTDGMLNPGTGGASWLEEVGHEHEIEFDSQEALPEICLWRKLRKGDKVRIIRLEGGAIHWVTGRIEDNIANDSDEDGGKYGTT